MKIVTSPSDMKSLSLAYRKAGRTIGFVPTMGALHEGHLSLLAAARAICDIVVMSIFVNPTQFGPSEDFSTYPRPFDADCAQAEQNGCDVVFAPAKENMYPKGYSTYVNVETITDVLCGARRPGHFKGVCTVVLKLFNIVSPHIAVFGQKDLQQCMVIKRMVQDLVVSVRLVFAPIVREHDGLAKSSRNVYLTKEERGEAPLLYKGLLKACAAYEAGERNAQNLKDGISHELRAARFFSTEYIDIVDLQSSLPVSEIKGPAGAAVAVRTGRSHTRLIDNILLGGTL
jgi:pantoate--beta-alanine ligase